MRSDLLQHELARTSAVFGRKDDVRVVFRADAALTDGSTIVLPSMGSGLDVDDETEWIYVENVDQLAGTALRRQGVQRLDPDHRPRLPGFPPSGTSL